METEYLKTLWFLRFQKILKEEQQAQVNYRKILHQCEVAFKEETQILKLLRQLIIEERGHEILAEELFKICQRNHPESEILTSF